VSRLPPGEPPADEPSDQDSGLLRNSAVMAVATVVSRLSGFVRAIVMVAAIGTGIFGDAFQLANSIPTSVYILVAGGALNSVFMPQLVRAMQRDDDGGEAFGQRLLSLVMVVLAVMSVAAVALAPWLVSLFANPAMRLPANQPYFQIAVSLARYCLPQIFFYGLYVVLGQILNARGRFGPMMWAPLLNNVVSIGVFALYLVVGHGSDATTVTAGDLRLLGLGSTVGIAVQALCLVPLLRRAGFRLRVRSDLRRQGLDTSVRLAIWTIGFVVVNQIWLVVATRITTGVSAQAQAAGLPGGYGLTPYLQAYVIFSLPHSVVTVSLVTALLPQISRAASRGDLATVRRDVARTLRLVAVALAPAAAAFVALGTTFSEALFRSDQVSASAARFLGLVLAAFAPALLGFCSHYVTLRAYYAQEDTRTPLFVQLGVVAASSVVALTAYQVLPLQQKTLGVAFAYGVGYWLGFGINLLVLRRRLDGLEGRSLASTFGRAILAAVVAGGLAWGVVRVVDPLLSATRIGLLLVGGAGALVLVLVYLLAVRILRVRELDDVIALVRRRVRPAR